MIRKNCKECESARIKFHEGNPHWVRVDMFFCSDCYPKQKRLYERNKRIKGIKEYPIKMIKKIYNRCLMPFRIMKKYLSGSSKIVVTNSVYKEYREDLKLWEEKIIIFWGIHYYIYSIFRYPMEKEYRCKTLFIKSPKTKKYFKFVPLPPVKVGRKEFEEVYKNNKWMIPINYELDLNRP